MTSVAYKRQFSTDFVVLTPGLDHTNVEFARAQVVRLGECNILWEASGSKAFYRVVAVAA